MNKYVIFYLSILLTLLIGYCDYRTGAHISMMLLYSIPLLASAWFCGRKEGISVAIIAAVCWYIVNITFMGPGETEVVFSWNALTRLGIFCMIAYAISLQAQLRRALERERLRADTDRLTGLLNKEAFRERVEEEMIRSRRYNHPLTLAFVDLDNFKQVNDTGGHDRGDKLLKLVSLTIVNTIRETDVAGRIGGDEFTVCFPETDEEQARNAIAKLVKALDIMTSQSGWQVTASIGVVTCLEICETYDALLGTADKLMYVVKENGKNAAEFDTVGKVR
ncbi:MAG: diguanylate cyclase [Desulfuromonadaceae bacterium]|nr:diguanylate cyclase [Desulfuromonadaceae bacterium]MDD5105400.1 diguanylate cyclase [Desulfuromonadaceae bacterium]